MTTFWFQITVSISIIIFLNLRFYFIGFKLYTAENDLIINGDDTVLYDANLRLHSMPRALTTVS